MWSILLPLALSSLVRAQDTQRVLDAFTQDGIVPDVLPSFSPLATLNVVFTDPTTSQQVNITPAMNLTTAQTASEPQFFLSVSNSTFTNSTFVIAMVDPDAPTPQNTSISQVRHMLGGSFQADPTTGLLSNTTAALSDYIPPAPPAGSDAHRYVILLFNQSAAFTNDAPSFVNASTDRLNFNLTQFTSAVQLGTPIAGNFFFTAPDNVTTSASSTLSAPLSTAVSTAGIPVYSIAGSTAPATSGTAAAQTTAPGSDVNGALSRGYANFSVVLVIWVVSIALNLS